VFLKLGHHSLTTPSVISERKKISTMQIFVRLPFFMIVLDWYRCAYNALLVELPESYTSCFHGMFYHQVTWPFSLLPQLKKNLVGHSVSESSTDEEEIKKNLELA
jgi:hypothetical protein